jgi:hypothetical protein
MTTTTYEVRLAELDTAIVDSDKAHARLLGQIEELTTEQAQVVGEWTELAARGNVDAELTSRRDALSRTLTAVNEALEVNRQEHGRLCVERDATGALAAIEKDLPPHRKAVADFEAGETSLELTAKALDAARDVVVELLAALGERQEARVRLVETHARLAGLARAGGATTAGLPSIPLDRDPDPHHDLESWLYGIWFPIQRYGAQARGALPGAAEQLSRQLVRMFHAGMLDHSWSRAASQAASQWKAGK